MSENQVNITVEMMNRSEAAFAQIIANTKQIAAGVQQMADKASASLERMKAPVDKLKEAFRTLDIRSSLDISAERDKVIAAFNEIKNSGTASARDIAAAQKSAKEKLAALGAEAKNTGGKLQEAAKSGTSGFSGLSGSLTAIAGKFIVLRFATVEAFQLMNDLVFKYQSTIETAQVGIAAAYLSNGKYVDQFTGKTLTGLKAFQTAQAYAVSASKELQGENFKTIATLDQMIRSYQEALPVALARGFNTDQVMKFNTAMVQAAGAIGLPMDQMGEETRSLLTGAINPRTSRIATVLGLRNSDIAKYKDDAQGLFDFLMNRLSAFSDAGVATQNTWNGILSNFIDLWKQTSGTVSEPIFETVKTDLKSILDSVATIDQKTHTIQWNQKFLRDTERLKTTAGVLTNIANSIVRIGGAMESGALGSTMDRINGLAQSIKDLAPQTNGDWLLGITSWLGKVAARGASGPFSTAWTVFDRLNQATAPKPNLYNETPEANPGMTMAVPSGTTYEPNPPPLDISSDPAIKAAIARGKKLKDIWQVQADDYYNVQSRTVDILVAKDKAASDIQVKLNKSRIKSLEDDNKGYTDSWLIEARDRDAVQSRSLDLLVAKDKAASDIQVKLDKSRIKSLEDDNKGYTDSWLIEARDRDAVQSRSLDLLVQKSQESDLAMQQFSRRTAKAMEQNFSNFYFDVMTNKFKTFGDYVVGIFNTIARAASDSLGQMTKEWLFGGANGGKSSLGGGVLGQATGSIGDWITGLFGSGMNIGSPIELGSGMTTAFGMHGGGVAGSDWAFTRNVPASLYFGAPRYHTGLGNDEIAAILKRKEVVLTEGQAAGVASALSGGGSTVNVFNYSGGPVSKQTYPNGDVDIIIGAVASDIANGGPVHSAMIGAVGQNIKDNGSLRHTIRSRT